LQAPCNNGDGFITLADVLVDLNGDGFIDEADLALYLAENCTHFVSEWVFSVADLVVVDHEITNDEVKLLKMRFYPVSTTEFIRS